MKRTRAQKPPTPGGLTHNPWGASPTLWQLFHPPWIPADCPHFLLLHVMSLAPSWVMLRTSRDVMMEHGLDWESCPGSADVQYISEDDPRPDLKIYIFD